jgi:pyruvate formate lyase activating enzyme
MYCHNPETWAVPENEGSLDHLRSCGIRVEIKTPEEILAQALRYRTYWKNGGGITVSGGEALLQIDFVTELFRLAKEEGVNTCLDTSGNPFTREGEFFEKFVKLCDYTDLFMLDIKHIDDEKHKTITGFTNKNILDMAEYLSDNGKDMWIRHVLVPGLTTDEEDLKRLADFIKTLKTVKKVEVLPYHKLGIPEYERLQIKYRLEGTEPPTKEQVEKAKEILSAV